MGKIPTDIHLYHLILVHVSYLDGKGNLAPQGSGKAVWILDCLEELYRSEGPTAVRFGLHLISMYGCVLCSKGTQVPAQKACGYM